MVTLLITRASRPQSNHRSEGFASMPKTKTKPTEEEDLELEDLEADVEESESSSKPAKQEVEFGAADLAKYLSERTGKTISTRELRALIRKMAREDSPRVNREIKAGNRTRYDWPGGLKNPEVKAIVKAVTGGELEADKQAKLAELKEKKAKQKAAETNGVSKKSKKGKKAQNVAVVEIEDDEDVEEIEIDDEDE